MRFSSAVRLEVASGVRGCMMMLCTLLASVGASSALASPVTPGVSIGHEHTSAIHSDGTLWAWGGNQYGQVGNGTNVDAILPVQVGTDHDWSLVSSGGAHTLAIRADGSLWAWGRNYSGELGDGTRTDRNAAVRVGTATNWNQIAAGGRFSLGIRTDGSLWAWGSNESAQLGDGSTDDQVSPIRIGSSNDWAKISAGATFAAALKTDGTVWHWGRFPWNDTELYGTPTQIYPGNNWVAVEAGNSTSFAIEANGAVQADGDNSEWQLGTGRDGDGLTGSWRTIAAAGSATIGIKSDGTLWAWGLGYQFRANIDPGGRCPNGEYFADSVPMQISTATDWASVAAAGQQRFAAIKTDGTVWTWGDGILGKKRVSGTDLIPQRIGSSTDWLDAYAGPGISYGIKRDHSLWWWGASHMDDGTMNPRSTPTRVGANVGLVATGWGWPFSVAGGVAGGFVTWGRPPGECNGLVLRGAPSFDGGGVDTDPVVASLAAGSEHYLSVMADGTLHVGGINEFGQLGTGNVYDPGIAEYGQLGTDADWSKVAAGSVHSLAIKNNGTLWAWGSNVHGQLGDGTYIDKLTPVRVGTGAQWGRVSARNNGTAAIKQNGTLWRWGAGVGPSPVKFGADTNWADVAGNYWDGFVALKTDGSLWSWTQSTATLRRIGLSNDWAKISSGDSHVLAIKQDGSLWGIGGVSWELASGELEPDIPLIAPVVQSFPALTAIAQQQYRFKFSAIDLNGDTVTLGAISLPSWLSFNPATGVLSGTPALSNLGTHSVVLVASDGVLTTKYVFKIAVNGNTLNDQSLSLPLNEGGGLQSADDSINGLTATLNNAIWAPSFEGQSVQFSSTGYISVPDVAALDLTAALTLEAWVKPSANSQNAYFIAKNYDATNQFTYGLGMRAGALHATLGNVIYKSSYIIPRDKWSHVAATWNGTMLRLYANGAQVFSTAVTGPLSTNTQRLLIGARNANGTGFAEGFVGAIDGVELWEIALSPQSLCLEVGRTWNGSTCTGEVFNNVTPTASSAAFSTTVGNVLYGTVTATNADGDPLTFMLDAGPTKGTVQITNPSTGAFRYVPSVTGADSLTFRVADYFGVSGLATVNINVTAGAASDSDGDGMNDVTEAQHGLNPSSAADGRQDKDHDGLSNYNEVVANRNPTIPFETDVLHVLGMSFREGSGTAPRDATNAANHGTFNGTKAKWIAGPNGNAFATTATSGVTIPDKASLDITGAFSIDLWIKPSTSNQTSYLVAKNSDAGAGTFDYGFGLSGGKLRAILTGNTYTSGYIVPVNEWTHVALTWDAAKVRIYANGNIIYTTNRTQALTANNKPLVIGARNTPSGALTQGFTGELDQVNVWRRALSGSEVCTASGGVLNASVCAH